MPPFSRFNPWVGASDPDEFDPRSVRKLAIGDMLGTMGNSLVQGASTGSWGDLAQGINAAFAGGSKALENRYLQEEDKFRARRKDDIDFRQEQEQLARQGRDREEFDRLKLARERKLEVTTPAIERVASEISEEIKSKSGKEIPEGQASQLLSRISLAKERVLSGRDEDSIVEAMETLKEVGEVIGKPDLDKFAKRRMMEFAAIESGNVQVDPDGNPLMDEMGFPVADLDSYAEELVDKDADERIERRLNLKYRQAAIDNIYADNARSDENKDKPPTAAELNKEYSSLLDALATVRDPSVMGVSDGEGGVGMFFDPTITPEVMKASMILGLGDKRRKLNMEEISKLNKLGKDQNFLRQMAIDRATAIKRQGIPPSLFGSSDEIVDNVGAPAAVEDDGIFSDSEIKKALAAPGVTIDDIEEEMRLKGVPEEEILRKLAPYRTR